VRQQAAAVVLDLRVPAELDCFRGHFPGTPLLPGVVQVDWVMHLARAHLQITGEFQGLQRLKFQRVIRPGARLALELRRESDGLGFTYRSTGDVCSSGRILIGSP
jgi:3-hydroxymyristoyl/3-hydroxydecanoyl-(acyl carrier protein) dehydratase